MALEMTPKEIDEQRTREAIDVQLNQTLARMDWSKITQAALKQHPTVFRKAEPVSEGVRRVQVEAIKRRTPKRFKSKLP
jgi:hypothetical protein